ncbi:MAG: hypothetical protein P1Q69_10580 [Candidatus Thorarchaeota archaeon]|nr:hypothetical protein [Candidatus Thorarchaeota archaeon]
MENTSIDFLEIQKKILRLMFKSHRMLTAYIYANVFIIYGIMVWVGLFILWMGLPLELALIAFTIIAIPLLAAPIIYRHVKRTYPIIQDAGKVLESVRADLDNRHSATGLSTYITLLFKIIQTEKDESEEADIEQTRMALRKSRFNVLSEIILQGFLFTLAFVNFLIPEILLILEQSGIGGLLANPIIVVIGILLIILAIRWGIYIQWQLLVRRWLRIIRASWSGVKNLNGWCYHLKVRKMEEPLIEHSRSSSSRFMATKSTTYQIREMGRAS